MTNSYGISDLTSADRFTFTEAPSPVITTISTNTGPSAGGTSVTLSGTGFIGTTAVLFGLFPATSFIVSNDARLTAIAPPQAAGTYDITVVSPTGVSLVSTAARFTYTAASTPTVSALNITSGTTAGATIVTVTGTNFLTADAVYFGSVPASFTILSSTSLLATAPPQAAATVHVTVHNDGGTSSTSSSDQFTISNASAPSVSAVTPTSITALPGAAITITGSNLTGATSVYFGSTAATFFPISDTTLVAYVPAGLSGTLHTTVTTFAGTSSTSSSDEVAFSAPSLPTITALSTSSGDTKGGTSLLLTGTGFLTTSAVHFGDVFVSNFVVNSDTQLTVLSPAQFAGTYDITVTTAAGTSLATSDDRFAYSAATAPDISGISTNSGSTTGGTAVVLSGSDFTGVFAVYFGSVPASFSLDSDSQITAYAPSQAAGTVHITVTTFAGTSPSTSDDLFTFNAQSAPTVTGRATTSGSTAGGTLVALTGTNFLGATSVKFGSVEAPFTVNDSTSISALAPSQAAGTVHITVTTYGGTSSTSSNDQFTFNAASAPSVSSISPTSGSTPGGTVVLVLGANFTGATAVNFGSLPAASWSLNSDGSLTAVSPPSVAGAFHITVTTPSGTSSTGSGDSFTFNNVTASAPAVTGLSLTTGSTAGGMAVLISGTNFSGASGVVFGMNSATFTILDDSTILATVPSAFFANTVDVKVTTNNGQSAAVAADQFTYLAAGLPTVTSLGTSTGSTAGGTSVAITGTNFTSASAVVFGSVAATSFTVNSSTSITATSPAQWAGATDVRVTTPSGTSAINGNDVFTYTLASAPTLTSLDIDTDTSAGGTTITITGTNLLATIAVYFGSTPAASFAITNSTTLTAVTPANTAGDCDVCVTTYAGTSAASSDSRFSFTAADAPTITALGTSSGTTGGGTSVGLTGTDFTGATRVRFGDLDAQSFTINSPTSITAIAPAQAAGTLHITVTTPTGISEPTSDDEYTYNAASAPAVTSLGTSSGSTAGGTSVTLTGTDFLGVTSVLFGTVAASFVYISPTAITAIAPPHASGAINITVTTPSGTSSTGAGNSFTYNAASAPSVSSVSPSSGSTTGGTLVTILGSNFTGASAVAFGTSDAWSFTVLSDSAILATAPAGSAGTIDVRVTTPSGQSSTGAGDHFTYASVTAPTLTALSAPSGTTAGGTALTLTGTGFLNTTGVYFGGTAVPFIIVSDTALSVLTPSMPALTLDITVAIAGASSALTSAGRFTFTAAAAPAVTGLSASSGSTAGGDLITITGTDLTGVTSVAFGGIAAAFTFVSSTTLIATAPSQAAGTIDVIVSSPTGTSEVSSDDEYTYSAQSAPTLSGLSLTTAGTTGGVAVNLTGTHFLGATGVSFGSVAAGFTVLSDTWIVATAPSQAAGTISVTVTTPGGTSGGSNFTYTSGTAPSVSAVTPAAGSTAGGDLVLLTGAHFLGTTDVQFDGTSAPSFTVLSDTSLSVIAPAGAAGTIDVTVVTPEGTSSTSSADELVYSAPSSPTVTGFDVSSGGTSGGTVLTITGTNFLGTTAVAFGSYPAASFVVNSATKITAVAPSQAAATIDVRVTTAAGQSATSSSDHFTYSASSAPIVSSVAPSAGPLGSGNPVTLRGSGFLGATAVAFGANAAVSFSVLSDSTIFAVAPAGSAATIDVTVTSPSGTSTNTLGDNYTYQAAPTASSTSPNSDTATGGILVTLTGTNLTGALAVYFGTTATTDLTVTSSTTLTVRVPAHAAGSVDVTVLTPGGLSSSVSFTYNAATGVTWIAGSGSWGTGANWSGGSVPGASDDVVIPAGVTVTHSTGTDTVHGLSVLGTLTVSGGTLSVAAAGAVVNLTQSGGTLDGTGALSVSGTWSWTGGTHSGAGTTTLVSGGTGSFNVSGGTLTLGRNVVNSGAVTWTDNGTLSFSGGAVWTNAGSFTTTVFMGMGAASVSGTGTFSNSGTFTANNSNGTSFASGVSFDNTGTLTISAGTLTLAAGTNSATITVSGGSLSLSGYTLTSSSTITGAVTFTGGTSTLNGTISSFVTINSGATVNALGGTVSSLTNNGTLSVGGGGVATLTITNAYTQNSSATLNMAIAGTGSYSQLNAGTFASLGGTLNVSYLGGFTPSTGNSFTLLTGSTLNGTFSTINGTSMTAHYNSTDFWLTAALTPLDRPEEEAPPAAEERPPLLPQSNGREVLVVVTASPWSLPAEPAPLAAREAERTADVFFTEVAAGDDRDVLVSAALAWDDLLALPLRLLLEVVEQVV